VTKLIVAFRNFAKAPKNVRQSYNSRDVTLNISHRLVLNKSVVSEGSGILMFMGMVVIMTLSYYFILLTLRMNVRQNPRTSEC
jgi:hypothetical protein